MRKINNIREGSAVKRTWDDGDIDYFIIEDIDDDSYMTNLDYIRKNRRGYLEITFKPYYSHILFKTDPRFTDIKIPKRMYYRLLKQIKNGD